MKNKPSTARKLHPKRETAIAHLAVVVPPGDDLRESERIIDDHVHSGLAAGAALARIRDREQYTQDGFKSFEMYLRTNAGEGKRWRFTRRYAFNLLRASEVAEAVHNCALDLPPLTVESHARELAKLPDPKQQVKAWASAVEAAGEKPVTAPVVKAEVAKLLPPAPKKAKKETDCGTAAPVVKTETLNPIATTPSEPTAPDEDEGEGGYEDPVGAEMLFRVEIERELDDVADRWFARCSERETLAQLLINLADELRRRDANP